MNAWRRAAVVCAEAARATRSQRVASLITVLVFAAMVSGVVLTNGKAVGSQREAIASLESVGARTISVRAQPSAGLDVSILARISALQGVEWAGAFGPVTDVHNGLLPDGVRVGERSLWTRDPARVGLPEHPRTGLLVSRRAMAALGLTSVAGYTVADSGLQFPVTGVMPESALLDGLEPIALVHQGPGHREPVASLMIVTTDSALITPLTETLATMLPTRDPELIRITSDPSVVELQDQIGRQFESLGIGLVLSVLTVSGLLVSALLSGLVLLRRKDFGRRRALGASRAWIMGFVSAQTILSCLAGALLGSACSAGALVAGGDPVPSFDYFIAVISLALVVAAISAAVPAALAATRDPIRELRVP